MPDQFICERIERSPARPSAWQRVRRFSEQAATVARLTFGVPDYRTYLEHCRKTHPDVPPMSYEAFFRSRIDARYGGGNRMRCC